jgi:hypothetical protein
LIPLHFLIKPAELDPFPCEAWQAHSEDSYDVYPFLYSL